MDIADLIEFNVLERSQMAVLLESHRKMRTIRGLCESQKRFLAVETIFFGFSNVAVIPGRVDCFQMSSECIVKVQKQIDAFIALGREREGTIVFVLGITNHWVL